MRAAALALAIGLALPAAGGPSPARAAVAVSVERGGDGAFLVAAEGAVAAPPTVMWATLTDYDNLAAFIPDIRVSRVVSGPGEPLAITQEGTAKILGLRFPIRSTMAVETEEGRLIRFRRLGGNLAELDGTYRLEPAAGGGTLLRYEARLRPDFWVPPWIGAGPVQRIVTRQVRGLVGEAERRAAAVSTNTPKEGRP